MRVEARDLRPPSLLSRRPPSRVDLVAGAVTTFGAHVLVPLLLSAVVFIGSMIGLFHHDAPPPVPEHEVMEARFVQLGKQLDPHRLPNRHVHHLQTAPPDRVAVSRHPHHVDRADAGVRPENPTEDLLTRLGDRAQTFAEIAQQREREGSPDGIEEGTAEAHAGDVYAGKLYAFFRRGWTVPTVLSDEERSHLTTEVDIDVGADLHITGSRVRHSSGNALFDQSVLDRLQQIEDGHTALPTPPPEVADQYVGRTIGLRFRGRDATSAP